ncbi:MAG: peptide deformylase [Acidimicrobiales bacterium]|nr:peptide deformylase [Acidimicrobiales bacterium]
MSPREIRIIGDPVLRKPATEVTELTGALARLADEMVETMYEAPGLGLAAPQVGVQKRFFVYDLGEGPGAIVNPTIRESDGEWLFEEGCLSVPGLSWEILRPKTIHIVGVDLNGKDVSIEADELEARLFQHELDHLDGILLVDLLDEDQARDARRALRELTLSGPPVVRSTSDGGLRLL